MKEQLRKLCLWYQAQCDTDWEHSYGIKIETMDNPGWRLKVDLDETYLEEAIFEPVKKGEYNENLDIHDPTPIYQSWYECFRKENQFVAYCGPIDLEEIIEIFLTWANSLAPETE